MTAAIEPMLDIDEAARALAITSRTLQRLAKRGVVPGAKIGGEWRFPANIAEIVIKRTQADLKGRAVKGGR